MNKNLFLRKEKIFYVSLILFLLFIPFSFAAVNINPGSKPTNTDTKFGVVINSPEDPITNNNTIGTVNNSQYLQGLTPQQVANLYIETDPVFGVWESSFLYNYNQTGLGATGNPFNQDLNTTNNVEFVNVSATLFIGLYNWVIGVNPSQRYLSFNGSTLNFNETSLNSTIDSRISLAGAGAGTYNATYHLWAYNQTAPANTYTDTRGFVTSAIGNGTYVKIGSSDQIKLNIANITNFLYNYNQTAPANTYTDTRSFITSLIGNNTYLRRGIWNNTKLDITNITGFSFNYNQTAPANTYTDTRGFVTSLIGNNTYMKLGVWNNTKLSMNNITDTNITRSFTIPPGNWRFGSVSLGSGLGEANFIGTFGVHWIEFPAADTTTVLTSDYYVIPADFLVGSVTNLTLDFTAMVGAVSNEYLNVTVLLLNQSGSNNYILYSRTALVNTATWSKYTMTTNASMPTLKPGDSFVITMLHSPNSAKTNVLRVLNVDVKYQAER